MKKLSFILLAVIVSISVTAQTLPKDINKINQLLEKAIEEDKARNARVEAYLVQTGELRMHTTDGGQEMFIYDVIDGKPTYLITHNEASVTSLGVNAVREGGGLGVNLVGENSRVAIWDGGISRDSHQEFEGRLKNNDSGADFSNHSTHVMGTLLAGGIDSKAKGFIPGATAKAFDFNDDTQEMLLEIRDNDLLISNHSYGVPGGWVDGTWRGDRSISEEEDYRFGFYSSRSASIDNVAHSAPYYSIVKSAGNDRGDSGDGTHPPDGPFDCIGDFGVSKNVFTIGAVNKIPTGYTGPEDVVMSSFSGWGPVDDGRIKPDFVAPGVSLFSSIAGSDESYGSLSGTSMAAPSATGGLTLMNEAYHLFNGTFLRSATLKALAVHTINEAGNAEGPDYQFGWGLLNVEGAVKHVIENDGVNNMIIEDVISDGAVYEIEINPVAGRPITVTVAWSDPAGSPVGIALDPTDLMLVNDLDVRIVDDIGNEFMPYILDPTIPGKAASRGDNFRDNLEKIYFPNPEGRKYNIRISHKGSITGNTQAFGMIVSMESEDPGISNLYWIDDNGNWDDNSQWSFSSGGNSSDAVPGADTKLIFDDNSFSGEEGTVVMDRDFTVAAVAALNNKKITFDLGGNTLTVNGSMIVSSDNFIIKNGSIVYLNEDETKSYNFDVRKSSLSDINIISGQNNRSTWNLNLDGTEINKLEHDYGTIVIAGQSFTVNEFYLARSVGGKAIVRNSEITITNNGWINFGSDYEDDVDVKYLIEKVFTVDDNDLLASVEFKGNTTLNGRPNVREVIVSSGTLTISERVEIGKLECARRSNLRLISSITVIEDISLNSNSISSSVTSRRTLNVLPREKYCFEDIDIDKVDLGGNAAISIGTGGSVTDASGWAAVACEDLLFANFNAEAACVGGILYLSDASDGKIDSYNWLVGDESIGENSQAYYYISDDSPFTISLTVSNLDGQESEWSETITPSTSTIGDNDIIQNSTQLASRLPGESYQWFKNGDLLEGETGRVYSYDPEEPASYFVVIFEEGCNKRSEVLDLTTSVINLDTEEGPIDFFPIPFQNEINLSVKESIDDNVSLKIYNALGMLTLSENLRLNNGTHTLNTLAWNAGVYIGVIEIEDKVYSIKLIKK